MHKIILQNVWKWRKLINFILWKRSDSIDIIYLRWRLSFKKKKKRKIFKKHKNFAIWWTFSSLFHEHETWIKSRGSAWKKTLTCTLGELKWAWNNIISFHVSRAVFIILLQHHHVVRLQHASYSIYAFRVHCFFFFLSAIHTFVSSKEINAWKIAFHSSKAFCAWMKSHSWDQITSISG